jgi:UPF0042 nucleotide-binding protein
MELVVITGMSGSGRTTALRRFEDMGWFCVDNLPPPLLLSFAELCQQHNQVKRVACVIDLRAGVFFDSLIGVIQDLRKAGIRTFILYLDASNEALIRRFKETRRKHPLFPSQRTVLESISKERQLLESVRERADKIIDTTNLRPMDLREIISQTFEAEWDPGPAIALYSFGFKYGLPLDADLVFDVRHLPNPHWVPELKELDGTHPEVDRWLRADPACEEYLHLLFRLIGFSLPRYVEEGKAYLTIALGCTGGRHRSVWVAEALKNFLQEQGYQVLVIHRDLHRGAECDA